jgi:hypothetical protein
VLAAAIPALWACNARRLAKPEPAPSSSTNDLFQQAINRNLDIVFMVDDSSSMTKLQNKLTANFPVFMNVLKNLPGGLPNVHIGVVSSSMGAGRNQGISHCMASNSLGTGNDQGVFHTQPLGTTCAKASLNAGQNFIINVNGQPNYTGDIADVFSCIAALGEGGCGFEHQFESVLRALGADGAPGPPQNAGFLREDAYLAIILITNEDDCSAPPDSNLFDGNTTTDPLTEPLGPLQSYRCNEFGHLCGGKAPPRMPVGKDDLTGTCVSAEDGRLLKVSDVVAAMKGIKKDPNKVLVAAIAGPNKPYVVEMAGVDGMMGVMWPQVDHSCMAADGTFADPSVRIQQWVDGFGGNGLFEVICNDTFEPALMGVANEIGKRIGAPCVGGTVLAADGTVWQPGATLPDCVVIDHQTNADGTVIDSTLLACPAGQTTGATACWHLDAGGTSCPGQFAMGFNRPGAAVTSSLDSSVSCSILACPAGTKQTATGCM